MKHWNWSKWKCRVRFWFCEKKCWVFSQEIKVLSNITKTWSLKIFSLRHLSIHLLGWCPLEQGMSHSPSSLVRCGTQAMRRERKSEWYQGDLEGDGCPQNQTALGWEGPENPSNSNPQSHPAWLWEPPRMGHQTQPHQSSREGAQGTRRGLG